MVMPGWRVIVLLDDWSLSTHDSRISIVSLFFAKVQKVHIFTDKKCNIFSFLFIIQNPEKFQIKRSLHTLENEIPEGGPQQPLCGDPNAMISRFNSSSAAPAQQQAALKEHWRYESADIVAVMFCRTRSEARILNSTKDLWNLSRKFWSVHIWVLPKTSNENDFNKALFTCNVIMSIPTLSKCSVGRCYTKGQSRNVHQVCIRQVRIGLPTLSLKARAGVSVAL